MTDVDTSPSHVRLLLDFVNTLDVEDATDVLSTTDELSVWLRDNELLSEQLTAKSDDLGAARTLRSELRAAMVQHHHSPVATPPDDLSAPPAQASPGDVASRPDKPLALRLELRDGEAPHLVPAVPGVRGGLARLVVAVVAATSDGTWPRLKICPAATCRWAFFDTSKNRSRTWCSMRVCGNRQKTKTYRARQHVEQ